MPPYPLNNLSHKWKLNEHRCLSTDPASLEPHQCLKPVAHSRNCPPPSPDYIVVTGLL